MNENKSKIFRIYVSSFYKITGKFISSLEIIQTPFSLFFLNLIILKRAMFANFRKSFFIIFRTISSEYFQTIKPAFSKMKSFFSHFKTYSKTPIILFFKHFATMYNIVFTKKRAESKLSTYLFPPAKLLL